MVGKQKENFAPFGIFVHALEDLKVFSVKYIDLNWGQITLNIIDGSHLTIPVKNIKR